MSWVKNTAPKPKNCPVCGSEMVWLTMMMSADYHCENCAKTKNGTVPTTGLSGEYFVVISDFTARSISVPHNFEATSVVYNLFKTEKEARLACVKKQAVARIQIDSACITHMPQGSMSKLGGFSFLIVEVLR